MILHLAAYLKQFYPHWQVVHYISVRAMAALLSSLALSLCWGPWFIRTSCRFFRSKARSWTPENHQLKDDMPTMGGIFITGIVAITVLLWGDIASPFVWIALLCLVGFGTIGAWDDWNKICYNDGIRASYKFTAQLLTAASVGLLWLYWVQPSTELYFPFFKHLHPELGFLFIPWVMFVLVGTSNAVNLTDGLDGLAIGALLSNFAAFSIIAYAAGHVGISHYLHIPFAGTAELAVVGSALFGASLGFLWFNTYPAQIFMGDVGSLSLGAVLAFMALACKQELLLAIAGGLFVIETLSVIIQVLSYKLFGRRWFKMAPIHHHFEMMGWKESKITVRFCIIAFVLSLVALMTLKIR